MREQEFLNVADRIGSRLCREAIWAENMCNWLGWSMEPINGSWGPVYRSFGSDFYSGTAGIALFLGHLYRQTGEVRHLRVMEGAVNHVLASLDDLPLEGRPGFFSGIGGISWSLIQIGELIGHEGLILKGLDILGETRHLKLDKTRLDVISGSAGMIPLYLHLSEKYKRDSLYELALTHGHFLLEQTIKSDSGWCWDTMNIPHQQPLTGHSHGSAGITTALLELYVASGENRFREAAFGSLAYERSLFSSSHGNWPDLRLMNFGQTEPGPPVYNMAWCHGAPGIGLSRLRCLELCEGDLDIRRELEISLQTTAAAVAAQPQGMGNFSLCHGLAGNTELLIEAAGQLGRSELLEQAKAVGRLGIMHFDQQGGYWPCGVPQAGETPGLLLGLAGIGYFYLRLFDQLEIPSILLIKGAKQTMKPR